jgi:methionyl-tRNA synthetase
MLRDSKKVESFEFFSLEELRDWLNRFNYMNLDAVHPEGAEYFVLDWYEETLSDGSIVRNARISMHD